jgi:hypothetical protein
MENQHRQIKGYRELDQATIDLMNEVKEHGEKTRELLARVHATLPKAEWPEGYEPTEGDQPMYWFRNADGQYRAAQMALVRRQRLLWHRGGIRRLAPARLEGGMARRDRAVPVGRAGPPLPRHAEPGRHDHHRPPRPDLGEVEAPDVLTGGTPCQAFSVAGLRESLADARGNLTLKFVELANAIDHVRAEPETPPSSSGKTSPVFSARKTTPSGAFWLGLPEKMTRWNRQGAVVGRWLCVWTRAGSRLADPGRPIFRPGPTTPPCVRCRKCSRRVRSRPGTF